MCLAELVLEAKARLETFGAVVWHTAPFAAPWCLAGIYQSKPFTVEIADTCSALWSPAGVLDAKVTSLADVSTIFGRGIPSTTPGL